MKIPDYSKKRCKSRKKSQHLATKKSINYQKLFKKKSFLYTRLLYFGIIEKKLPFFTYLCKVLSPLYHIYASNH